MVERTSCVVAGGGPAGMILGLLLARAGVEVTVLEKHGDFLRDFRGDTVHPSTIQLLDELGLGERFAALPHSTVDSITFPTSGNGGQLVFGAIGQLKVPHPYIALVPQWDLLNLLAETAQAEPTFNLRMHTEVTGLLREGRAVRGVRYRTAGGKDGELRADLTVAADGRGSLARREAGLRPREFPVPIDTWWFRLPRRDSDAPALTPRMRHHHFAVLIPREGYFQVAYLAHKGSDTKLRAEGLERFRERVADAVPPLADRVDSIGSMDEVKHLDVRLDRLRRWHTSGLLCIGDAAHAMSPIGGVGINLAVQDAVAAAHLLAGPLRRGHVRVRDLARVQSRRWLPTALVQGLQRLLHRAVVKPVIDGRRDGPPNFMIRLVRTFPAIAKVPAYLIGVGIRPEHAPDFARRCPPLVDEWAGD